MIFHSNAGFANSFVMCIEYRERDLLRQIAGMVLFVCFFICLFFSFLCIHLLSSILPSLLLCMDDDVAEASKCIRGRVLDLHSPETKQRIHG